MAAAVDNTSALLQWTSSDTVSVTAGGTQTSDAFSGTNTQDSGTAVQLSAEIVIKADNSTSPASDDQVDAYWLASVGDPDGASTAEFVTVEHGHFLGRLDTNLEDPAILRAAIPVPFLEGKLYLDGATPGNTNSITCSARLMETISTLE